MVLRRKSERSTISASGGCGGTACREGYPTRPDRLLVRKMGCLDCLIFCGGDAQIEAPKQEGAGDCKKHLQGGADDARQNEQSGRQDRYCIQTDKIRPVYFAFHTVQLPYDKIKTDEQEYGGRKCEYYMKKRTEWFDLGQIRRSDGKSQQKKRYR